MTKTLDLNTSITIHKVLQNVAEKLFSLFIPVLIYNATQNLFLSLLFVLFAQIFRTLLIFLTKNLVLKCPIFLMTIRLIPILLLQLCFIFEVNFAWWLVIILALLHSANGAFYWPSLNTIFAISTSENKAKAVGIFENAGTFGKMIAPVIGALLIFNNYTWVNIVVCFIFYAVALIFIIIQHKTIKEKINSLQPATSNFNNKKNLQLFYFLLGVRDLAVDQILPLVFAINNINVGIIGLSYSLLELGIIISNTITIFLNAKKHWFVFSVISCIILGVLLCVIPFFVNTTMAVIYTIIIGLLNPFCTNIMFAKFVKDVNTSIANEMSNREMIIIGAKIVPAGLTLLFSVLPVGVVFGGVAYFCYIFPYCIEYKKERNSTLLIQNSINKNENNIE